MRQHHQNFFTNLAKLSYPRHLLSVAVLIGDASAAEVAKVDADVRALKDYARVTLLHKDFNNPYAKHEAWLQLARYDGDDGDARCIRAFHPGCITQRSPPHLPTTHCDPPTYTRQHYSPKTSILVNAA